MLGLRFDGGKGVMERDNAMAPARGTILVVDDDQAIRNSLKFSLEIEGFAVRVYASGEDLLTETDIPNDGCLVIDYHLPGINGFELFSNLRACNCKLPAILATTHVDVDLRRRIETAGMVFVEKPFIGNVLPDAINAVLGRRSSRPVSKD
jgi:two-component system response regulator FixJ